MCEEQLRGQTSIQLQDGSLINDQIWRTRNQVGNSIRDIWDSIRDQMILYICISNRYKK